MTRWLTISGASGAVAVAAGAFAAHGLEARLAPSALETFKTAAQYHMWHTLALLLTAVAAQISSPSRGFAVAAWAFSIGMLLFSGSLYALALSGVRWLGAITPIGGLAFIFGWTSLAVAGWRARPTQPKP